MVQGALPALRRMYVDIVDSSSGLPSSWGYPGVLTNLGYLSITLHKGQLFGSLPLEWAIGFRSLQQLFVQCVVSQQPSDSGSGEPAPVRAPTPLPEWSGGFPELRALSLIGLGFSGKIPSSWMNGSMPALEEL